MGILNNGMSIMGISTHWQQVVKGLVLLGAVASDVLSKQRVSLGFLSRFIKSRSKLPGRWRVGRVADADKCLIVVTQSAVDH